MHTFLLLSCRLWLPLCTHLHETVYEEERKQRKGKESISFQLKRVGGSPNIRKGWIVCVKGSKCCWVVDNSWDMSKILIWMTERSSSVLWRVLLHFWSGWQLLGKFAESPAVNCVNDLKISASMLLIPENPAWNQQRKAVGISNLPFSPNWTSMTCFRKVQMGPARPGQSSVILFMLF